MYSPAVDAVVVNRGVTHLHFYYFQKLKLKRQFGYRDESIYQSGAVGQGASKNVKRQG